MQAQKRLTKEQGLEKIKHFCAYQERCHKEVKEKLYGFGLYKRDVEEIISVLIEENYLNEERFALRFATGKFSTKHWGKRKIQYEMQQKAISSYLIRLAMKQIDDEAYMDTLHTLAQKKWATLKGEHYLTRQAKATAYLMQKGYEPNLVNQVIHRIKSPESGND